MINPFGDGVELPDPPEAPEAPDVPRAPVSQPTVAQTREFLLGRDKSSFLPQEISYVDEQLQHYLAATRGNPSYTVYVNEIILTALDMQRLDREIVSMQRDPAPPKKLEGILEKKQGERERLLDRHTDALKMIGASPRDGALQMQGEQSEHWADVYLRYIKELNEMAGRERPVGVLSQEAVSLAVEKGLDPERYHADAMPPGMRVAATAAMQKVLEKAGK